MSASSSRLSSSDRWWPAARLTATSITMAISISWSAPTTVPAYLFRNDGGNRNHWLHVKLEGTKSNRSAIGAKVSIEFRRAAGRVQMVHCGSSYCSQSELALTFGLGNDTKVNAIEIEWPSGVKQHLANVNANQYLTIQESGN